MNSVRPWGCGLKDARFHTHQLLTHSTSLFSVHDPECDRRIHCLSRVHFFLGGDLLSPSLFITSSRITTQIAQADEGYSISDLAMATHLKQNIFQLYSPSFHCFPRLKIPSFIQPRGAFAQAHWGHVQVQSGFIIKFTFIT